MKKSIKKDLFSEEVSWKQTKGQFIIELSEMRRPQNGKEEKEEEKHYEKETFGKSGNGSGDGGEPGRLRRL